VAIKDFFKAKMEPDREHALVDPDQILAWLEELSRIRTVMDLRFGGPDLPILPAKVELVGEETSTCTLSLQRTPPMEPMPGQRVSLVFPLDGQRFQTELVYKERGGYLEYRFKLPTAITHAERRDAFRFHFRSRERVQIVVLTGLFEGLGLSGDLVDISMGGCAFILRRAIRIKDERRMPIRPDLLTPGTPLALVRLPDLPRQPLLECGGHVSHLHQLPGGVTMGVAFENLGALELGILGKFMAERIPGFHTDFPWKRRFRDLTEADRQAPQPLEYGKEPQAPAPDEAAEAFSDTEIEQLREAIHDEDRVNKLRKRGKKILLVLPDDLDRTLLMAILHQDGYRCLFEANSLIKALEANRHYPLDMVMVDQTVGHHGALEVIETLRSQGLPKKTPVVVIQRQPDVRLAVAARAGGVNLVLEHPVDFKGALKAPMEEMLGLVQG
jgi:CheY-like chemotaxis protein